MPLTEQEAVRLSALVLAGTAAAIGRMEDKPARKVVFDAAERLADEREDAVVRRAQERIGMDMREGLRAPAPSQAPAVRQVSNDLSR